MAIIDLGKVSITWRGTYAGGTAYTPKDAVVYNNASYICIANTTGNLPTDTTYWNVMAAKGVDGTNVGTTITTQGDILYRDGSGLQRLAAGTAGNVLQTGGSGANPSWTAVSSDFVKIQSTTVSSNVSSVTLTGFDDSVYASYYLRVNNAKTELTGTQRGKIMMRVNTAGGVQSGGTDYIHSMFYHYKRWDNDSQVDAISNSEGQNFIHLHDWSLSQYGAMNVDGWFANPSSTAQYKIFHLVTNAYKHVSTGSDGPYTMSPENINAVYQSTTAITGLTFLPTGNSATAISAGNFSLYGLKK